MFLEEGVLIIHLLLHKVCVFAIHFMKQTSRLMPDCICFFSETIYHSSLKREYTASNNITKTRQITPPKHSEQRIIRAFVDINDEDAKIVEGVREEEGFHRMSLFLVDYMSSPLRSFT